MARLDVTTGLLKESAQFTNEAVDEIDKRELHWMAAPDHNHTEIPESAAGASSRRIPVDSGATATTGTTGLLKSLGSAFLIVK